MFLVILLFGLIPASFAQSSSSESSDCDDSDSRERGRGRHNEIHGCPRGWQRFERDRGPWCIATFYNDQTGGYSWDAAQRLCRQHGAVLTGVESSSEQVYIMNDMISKWKTSRGAIWLGGKRKPACTRPSWNAQICDNPRTSFYWTDDHTSGNNGFDYWLTGRPDGLANAAGVIQSCIEMYMNSVPDPVRGFYDDQLCHFAYAPNVNMGNYGYACGKRPGH